jgi:hypothetical protein
MMKVIPFVFFLPVLSFLLSCSDDDEKSSNDDSNKIITLNGTQQRDTVFLTFNIPEKIIRAQRTGKLERLVERPEFKKNSLLVQFDDYDAFVELSGEKETLKEDLTDQLNNLPKALLPVEKKWRDFAGKLTPDKMTPGFPALEYKEEAAFLEEAKIEEKYRAIQQKEQALQNYFQLSTEDGFIVKAYAHTDEYVKKNKPLISYHPKKIKVRAVASFPLSKSIARQIKADLLVRVPVSQVKKVRISPTKITYTLTLNQKLDPEICPKYVIVNQDQNAFHVPKEFIGKGQKVSVIGKKDPFQAYHRNGKYLIYSDQSSLKIQRP